MVHELRRNRLGHRQRRRRAVDHHDPSPDEQSRRRENSAVESARDEHGADTADVIAAEFGDGEPDPLSAAADAAELVAAGQGQAMLLAVVAVVNRSAAAEP